jgi:sec-independent protein translocase protein TatB
VFDVGFSEIMTVGVVALVVIGPERMPGVARTVGALFGRAQRYVNQLKADIQKEVDLDELKNVKSSISDAARSFEQSVVQAQAQLNATARELNQSVAQADASLALAGETDGIDEELPSEYTGDLVQIPVTVSMMQTEVDTEKPGRTESSIDHAPEPAAAAAESEDPAVQMDFWLGPTPARSQSASSGA